MYTYQSLPKQHIRLATIQPGEFDDEITISLTLKELTEEAPPQYEALSYVWGPNDNPSTISVKDVSDEGMLVTQNLASALRYVRLVDEPRVMWIDAICINQTNDTEKSSQVAIMGLIYRLAKRVVVWLGPEENESNRVMRLMKEIGSQIEVDWIKISITSSDSASDTSLADRKVQLPFEEDDLCYICHLLCRPWFERLWVRQEIFLANSAAVVCCGSYSVSWKVFRHALACIYIKDTKDFKLYQQMFDRLSTLVGFIFQQPGGLHLTNLRWNIGNAVCKDPRDRIYGVLSLLDPPPADLGILPDYSKTAAQVYTDVVVKHLQHSGDLSILSQCQSKTEFHLPSWVPDWSAKFDRELILPSTYASGPFKGRYNVPKNGHLRVAGVPIGALQNLQNLGLHQRPNLKDFEIAIRRLISGKDLLANYVGGGSIIEAYIRTLCLDYVSENQIPSMQGTPELKETTQFFLQIVAETQTLIPEDMSSWRDIIGYAANSLDERYIFETSNGYIGIAPLQAMQGDEICVILGCNMPLLLRPTKDDAYILVGVCYACGVTKGEAVLGCFPEGFRHVLAWDETSDVFRHSFINDKTGEVSRYDPRLQSMSIDVKDSGPEVVVDIDPEILRSHGVDIKYFELL